MSWDFIKDLLYLTIIDNGSSIDTRKYLSNLLCNNCGVLVDYNLNDLIKNLKRLLSMDNKSLKLMRMNARRLIESKYSWNVKIDEIIEAIE